MQLGPLSTGYGPFLDATSNSSHVSFHWPTHKESSKQKGKINELLRLVFNGNLMFKTKLQA